MGERPGQSSLVALGFTRASARAPEQSTAVDSGRQRNNTARVSLLPARSSLALAASAVAEAPAGRLASSATAPPRGSASSGTAAYVRVAWCRRARLAAGLGAWNKRLVPACPRLGFCGVRCSSTGYGRIGGTAEIGSVLLSLLVSQITVAYILTSRD